MIQLVNITQHYGVRPVLRNIDLAIAVGKLTAVIGPNGMGKTTLLAVMGGVLTPQHGHVEINGLRRSDRPTKNSPFAARSCTCPIIRGCPSAARAASFCSASAGCTTSTPNG